MKIKYIVLLISGIALSIVSCKKSSSDNAPGGRWLQTKLRLYGDSANATSYDTTYTQPFTASDYLQFNFDGTCSIASDHYYYPNIYKYPTTPPSIPVSIATWNYSSISSSAYLLIQPNQTLNYAGVFVEDTIKVLSAHTLMLHVVIHTHDPRYYQTADSYYEK
jgi:hypothetical protein